jgi:hypothetical protein
VRFARPAQTWFEVYVEDGALVFHAPQLGIFVWGTCLDETEDIFWDAVTDGISQGSDYERDH